MVVLRPFSQITGCFEKISCFGLTHPGFDVVKKTYKGDIDKIQPSFRRLLDTYVRHIFGELVRGVLVERPFLLLTFFLFFPPSSTVAKTS